MEKLKDYWPLITIYFISLGYLYSLAYYSLFNLNIFPYLDIADVFQIQFGLYGLLFFTIISIINFAGFISSIAYFEEKLKMFWDKINNFEERNYNNIFRIRYSYLSLMLILFATMEYGIFLGKRIIGGRANREVILITDKSIIKTDKNNMYIGQTKNYIFLYNRRDKQTTVYKISDVNEIKFSKGIDYSNEKL